MITGGQANRRRQFKEEAMKTMKHLLVAAAAAVTLSVTSGVKTQSVTRKSRR